MGRQQTKDMVSLKLQKRLAASVLKCEKGRSGWTQMKLTRSPWRTPASIFASSLKMALGSKSQRRSTLGTVSASTWQPSARDATLAQGNALVARMPACFLYVTQRLGLQHASQHAGQYDVSNE